MFNKEKMTNLQDNYIGLRTSDGTGIYLLAFVFLYISNLIMLIIASLTEIPTNNLYFNYAVMFATQFSLFFAPILYAKMFNRDVIAPSRIKRSISPTQALICVGAALATIVACLPLANLVGDFFNFIGYKQQLSLPLAQADKWWTLPLSLIFVALAPAIGEEFLFRGNVGRALKRKSYVFAMIMTSLLFAIFHGNPLQLIHQFFLGMVMSYAYFVTGSLLAPIIIHFCNNATSIIVIFVQDAMNVEGTVMGWGTKLSIYIPMVIIGGILVYLILRALTRVSRKRAGIEVDKVSVSAIVKDFGKAFYPKGITSNIKTLNATMRELYNDAADNYIPLTPEEQVGEMEDLKLRDQLIESKKLMEKRRKRTDRSSMIIAIALAVAVIIFNVISGIVEFAV